MKKLLKKEKSILYSRSKGEKVLFAIFFIVFFCYAVSLVYPFVWLIGNSLKTRQVYNYQQAMGETFRFPTSFEFEHYVKAFTEMEYNGVGFVSMFFNSIFYTAITTAGGVFFSALTGYCLSKYRFRARGIIYALAIFSLTMPVIGTTGATYKLIAQIGAYDTWLYPVLISLGGFGFNFLIMYGFFSNVSFSYAEAVFVDGGGHWTVFFKIMLPQAKVPVLTLAVMSAIGSWNDYMTMLLYMPSFPTIASGLYQLSSTLPRLGNSPLYYAALVISVIPVLAIFAACSDLIMNNFTMGGLKG